MTVASRVFGTTDEAIFRSTSVQLVILVSVVSSLGSVASPALAPMSTDLGVSEAQVALVFTAFTLPAIFVLPLVGVIADLYGRRLVIVPGLLLFGLAGAGVGLTTSFELVLILRALQGIGYTLFNVLTVAMLGDLLDGTAENAAQGVRVVANKLTGFAGPVAAGFLAAIAWQYPFFLYAVAIPVAVLAYFYLEETAEHETVARQSSTVQRNLTNVSKYLRDLGRTVRQPFLVGILFAGFFRMFMKFAFYAFIAVTVVNRYDGSVAFAGILVGIYSLTGAVIATQSARVTRTVGYSRALLLGFVLAAVAFVVFPVVSTLVLLTVAVVVHGTGEGLINPVHKSMLTQGVSSEMRAGFVTTNSIGQNISMTIAPPVLSIVLIVFPGDGAYDILFFVTGAITLATLVPIYWAMSKGDLG